MNQLQRFELTPYGPYSLSASVRFLEGFAPAAYESAVPGHFHRTFVPDGGTSVAGVCIRDQGGVIVGEVVGDADQDIVRGQVARILSLDVDGRDFPLVGQRDPAIWRLQARFPGLRPVLFQWFFTGKVKSRVQLVSCRWTVRITVACWSCFVGAVVLVPVSWYSTEGDSCYVGTINQVSRETRHRGAG